MTAKEKIQQYYSEEWISNGNLMCHPSISSLESIMEDYANQKAIEFAEWTHKNGWNLFGYANKSWWGNHEGETISTTDKLYAKFEEETK